MPDRKSSSTSNSSRTAAKVAVAVLIVIAIGGFVLAGLKAGKSAPEQAVAADSTQQPAAAPTGAAPAAAASAGAPELPAHIVAFAPSAANLSEKELAKVRTIAETATKKNRAIEIVSTVEESQFGLAQQRVSLVRQTLVDSGVPLTRMSTQVSKVARGGVSATDANLVAMNLK